MENPTGMKGTSAPGLNVFPPMSQLAENGLEFLGTTLSVVVGICSPTISVLVTRIIHP